jgi:hypothetical protein
MISSDAEAEMDAAIAKYGLGNIGGAVEALGGRYSYGQLKVYRAYRARAENPARSALPAS